MFWTMVTIEIDIFVEGWAFSRRFLGDSRGFEVFGTGIGESLPVSSLG